MTEQTVAFALKNWGMIAWTISMIISVTGLIVYNAKVVLPGFVKRMDDMEKDIKKLQDESFVTDDECNKKHAAFAEKNEAEHKGIKDDVEKILKCVQKSEERRQAGKVLQFQFMTAVKEKLKLEFKVPTPGEA